MAAMHSSTRLGAWRRSGARAATFATTLAVVAVATGCASAVDGPRPDARTRREKPLSVCMTDLAPVKASSKGKSVVRQLDPEQWLEVLVPGYEQKAGLSPTSVDCTGSYLFANEMLRGGISARGWPRIVDPDELQIESGPQGLRVLWLRALKFENGDIGGPVAFARAVDDRAEVFAVGSYRGPAATKFVPVRLGNDHLVVAEAKRCPEFEDCSEQAYFYLPRRGRLLQAATIDLERSAVVPSVTERGLYAKYILRTDVSYRPDGVHLLEQMQVRIVDYGPGQRDSDRELRRVEFARLLRVERDTFFSSNDPLWERVVGQD